jgi:hypothetical protein
MSGRRHPAIHENGLLADSAGHNAGYGALKEPLQGASVLRKGHTVPAKVVVTLAATQTRESSPSS